MADVFQALAQRRPYREPLAPDAILQILREQVSSGKIDGQVVETAAAHLQDCWRVALGQGTDSVLTPG